MPRILLVEDDPMLSMFFARALRRAGYEVETRDRGDDGLEAALSLTPDMLVLDWHMPGIDGLEVLAGLRAAGNTARVLMLSGTADFGRSEAISAGADAFLAKPCGLDDLITAVRELQKIATVSAQAAPCAA